MKFTAGEVRRWAQLSVEPDLSIVREMLLYLAELLQRPAGVPDGWFLAANDLSDLQIASIEKLIQHAKRARWVDATVRKDAKETCYEADWIKHMQKVSAAAPQPERAAAEVPADERIPNLPDNYRSWMTPCVCGNEYLAIRTDVYKDKREFIYCDCCGATATKQIWQARSALAQQGDDLKQAPAAWVNLSSLIVAETARKRGGPYDQHTWSECETSYHNTPLYARIITEQQAAKDGE